MRNLHSIAKTCAVNITLSMNTFTKNPGFKHIAEEIFLNLDLESLEKCKDVNESWQMITENSSSFWLRKCLKSGLLKKNQTAWKKATRLSNEVNLEENVIRLLKEVCRINHFDKMLPFVVTPIYMAAHMGDLKFIEFLAPLTNKPNASSYGITPIKAAAENGHANIVKILAPLTKYPNKGLPRPNQKITPIYMAAQNGHLEVVKILAPLTKNPNYPVITNFTKFSPPPIYKAAENLHVDIVKALAPFTNQALLIQTRILIREEFHWWMWKDISNKPAKRNEILEILTDQIELNLT